MKLSSRNNRARNSDSSTQAGFQSGKRGKRHLGLVLFGLVFFSGGAFFCWLGVIKPLLGVANSADWPQVPCRIVSSEIEVNRDSDGDTYRAAITFVYSFEGQEYSGGQYNFSDMSSSGYDGKAAVVNRYPVGSETVCWVNPADPAFAVLSREMPGEIYFLIPFTSVFMLVGGAVMLGALGLLPASWTARFSKKHERVSQASRGQIELKPSTRPARKLMGILVFSLVWDGIVGAFLLKVLQDFQSGNPDWFLVLFLVPFVLIGIGCLGGVVYFALALANPKLRLTLSEGNPRLGQEVALGWKLSGSVHRLKNLTITLEGRESATYPSGKNSATDESLFFRAVVFETAEPLSHRSGQIAFSVPPNQIPTFQGGNNQIKWTLKVTGAIPRWPDVKENYPILVRPLEMNLSTVAN